MEKMKPLTIGELVIEKPVIQGGMGVGISLSSLAGAVAKAGGVGIISTAQIGFREPDFKENPLKANLRAIGSELKKAREIAPKGVIGFNIMVATRNYEEYVKTAVKAGADIIISGAGLPVSLPEYVREAEGKAGDPAAGLKTKLAPIVSSLKSVSVICKLWERKYQTTPDLVVIEGPLAGGHLGFSREQLAELEADTTDTAHTFHKEAYEAEIRSIIDFVKKLGEKYGKMIPVVVAGGIYTHEDVLHQLELGADGVQVATRFVTTEECDAPEAYKQAYIQAKQEDIVIAMESISEPMSLYEPVYSDTGDTLYILDQISDQDTVENWIRELSLRDAIRNLGKREQNILYLRFFQGKTQTEVAKEIGISQAQISRLEKGAITKIREASKI